MVVAGIPLPSDSPLFLALVATHVPAGLVCVIAGAVAMLSRKRDGPHPAAGATYYWSLVIVSATMAALSALRWSENYPLFLLGSVSLLAATFGRAARKRHWARWARMHLTGMGVSYVALITAFYVDNGPNLPLWRELPQVAFWTLPALVGTPILLWAYFRHPIVRLGKST